MNRFLYFLFLLAYANTVFAQEVNPSVWDHYGGSEKGMQYSGADQITAENVGNLVVAWTYRTGEMSEGFSRQLSFQANPILVEGKLYISSGSAIISAVNPATGEEYWQFDPQLNRQQRYSESANRGVSSWIDPQASLGDVCRHRIFVATLDASMFAVDGETGQSCADFGTEGKADLHRGVRENVDDWGDYLMTSPPVIVGNIVIVGSAIGDNRGVELEYGIVRGLDARSGKILWKWDPVPRDPADPMHSHWDPEQVGRNGAANAWAPLSADSARGIVYVPTGSASPDFYGGERVGDNRYANSLVALNASTGKVIWHQQLIHHDVWDYDLASQPTLVELVKDGEVIPAVIQATKTGFIFTFNRVTGEPLFAIEERPVPQGGVLGEVLSPTQPFPVAPPALVPNHALTPDDAWGAVFFDRMSCKALIEEYRSEGIFTPPSLQGTINMPGYGGGVNWGGLAFDPARQIAVVNPNNIPHVVQLIPRQEFEPLRASGDYPKSQFTRQSGTPYGMRRQRLLSPLGAPCVAPPWGTIAAVDMVGGDILWQIPFGTTEDQAPFDADWGMPSVGGPIITASGLIFIGAALDGYIRAYNIENGEELWRHKLPAGGQATPMTYIDETTGRQFLVIAAGGHGGVGNEPGDYVVAFALKSRSR